jgi:uncharacterized protein (DUF885 family)
MPGTELVQYLFHRGRQKMDDIEILNQPADQHPDHLEIEHYILDHNTICDSVSMLDEIREHLIGLQGLNVAMEGIALESLGETLKAYWQQFLAFLKKIWEKIVAFFEAHFTVLGRRRLHIKRMMTKVKSLSTNPEVYRKLKDSHKDIVIAHANVQAFMIGGKAITGAEELLGALTRTRAAVTVVTDDYAKYIVDQRIVKISKTLEAATVENAAGLYERIVQEMEHNAFHVGQQEMLGNVSVTYGGGGSDLDAHRLVLAEKQVGHQDILFTPMTIEDLAKVYANMEGVLDEMDNFKNGEYKQLVSAAQGMMRLTDTMVKKLSTGAQDGSAEAVKQLLGLNKHYVNWIKAPMTDLVRHITTSFFYIGHEMEENISLYEQHEALNFFKVIGMC